MRNEGLNSVITDAKERADILEVNPEFQTETRIRPRMIKKQFAYEQSDEPITSKKLSFKVNFFYSVLDVAIASFDDRFQLMKNHSDNFSFLYDIHSLMGCSTDQLEKSCLHLQKILTHKKECDIDGHEMHQELVSSSPYCQLRRLQ